MRSFNIRTNLDWSFFLKLVWSRKASLLLVGALFATALAQAPETLQVQASLTTREHLTHEHWWPTKQLGTQSGFAGTQACAGCHEDIVRTQRTAQMALTMMPASSSSILATHTGDIFTFGSYRYAVQRRANSFKLKISDGAQERVEPLQWAFGSGSMAQSYVFWDNDQLYESRFNYFASIRAFDRTPARLQGPPVSLEMAEGRQVAEFEARRCYACHSTALTSTEPLTAAHFYPGVTCEACHGPGRDHVAAIQGGNSEQLHIVNAAHLTPMQAVDFCGACHGTPKDVELMGMAGEVTVRFPAYRLEKSRCWGTAGDARLTCFACHNPHRPLEREAVRYDAACLHCHANGTGRTERETAQQPACPVAKSRCTSCHMPKYDVSGMHTKFTDHNIRIVQANALFPD